MTRINECALRENTVSSIKQTQKYLENEMNSKFSHIKYHMQNLDEKIKKSDSDLKMKIQDIKKKTLGKITGKA
jgi:disulfide oxidoreductase YuzD